MHEVTEKIAVRVCFSRLLQVMSGFVRGDKKRYSIEKSSVNMCIYGQDAQLKHFAQ